MANVKINPEGKVAFVSGSNRGIGKAIVIELLERGAKKVYAGARNTASLEELQNKYGERLEPVTLDVTDDQSIQAATAKVENLDILVNNAGIFAAGGIFSENANSSLQTNLDVNLWGVIKLSNAVADKIKQPKETAIINISSVAGLGNMPMAATYSVSKAAVHSLTQGMRAELVNDNTLVMGVYPGPIDTDMARDIPMQKDSPENVAKNIVQGLENGSDDVFPDVMSKDIGAAYASNPKGIEQQFGTFVAQ
ncbi:SDR family oxidoreductase [Fulvivirgaceae bacterium BMA10]|uniref:SDR family oxidoreductase n=1 Tax=Splendidivirga corallicola TaxID=3051826 RepID=A0ABT8KQC3_9BACT|nr:SDR family oxidoreductase [Fulvivirgaceae bacterium BMA10]